MQARQNAAYDLSRYEPKEAGAQPQLQVLEQRSRSGSYTAGDVFRTACVVAFLVGIISMILYSNVLLTELSDQVNEYTAVYTTLTAENRRLSTELESKMSMRSIEDAAHVLGLSAMEPYQVEYVSRCGEDKILRTADSPVEPEESTIAQGIDTVLEYLRIAFHKN